ncbi:hypothetical protein LTSEMIN_5191, partial [Salmonella enterica subsp. enterica serovar Minnesota str. A4-603]
MHTFGKAKRINQCVSNEKHDSQIGMRAASLL